MKVHEIPLTFAEQIDSDIKKDLLIVALKNPSFICNQVMCLQLAQISDECLQDYWSSEKNAQISCAVTVQLISPFGFAT